MTHLVETAEMLFVDFAYPVFSTAALLLHGKFLARSHELRFSLNRFFVAFDVSLSKASTTEALTRRFDSSSIGDIS